ncbi:carbohydrate ABC transporter permease [Curtobacterium sp. MCBD17_034]|uniref:carbohydrate ABC transporter permease n=1 Tax=unclassified Curtobacterium TaxID=257496 RepID=UPI000DA9F2FE|nr:MULTISPECIES: carbohydrate ABC transporter permease [unclassified Curtobacterium]PZE75028.1 carbohydrate ABC transporter permease [Curtobacterium sp. MCBD17_019]PZF58462.1 carbohydrate ABC transporter permease [Curtobacterium sp. MCBD17_034]PZM34451.1 carbohydrate ABC transporter permease [Curtobacterium sp. MCBD17_031]
MATDLLVAPRPTAAPRASRTSRRFTSGARLTAGIVLAILFLIPVLWMVTGAFKDTTSVTASPPQLLPHTWHPGNFADAITSIDFWTYLRNSAVVTVVTVIGTLLACVPAAYAFAVLQWRAKAPVFGVVLFSMMLPFPAIMVPWYLIFKQLGMIGTLAPLLLPPFAAQFVTPAFSSALAIFLLRQFLQQIPGEIVEAAKVDGAGSFRILVQILMPLARPVLVTITIMTALSSWTAFVGPLIFLNDASLDTLSLGLQQYQSQHFTAYNLLLAASTLFIIPVLAVFLAGQRYFTAGATQGAVK